MSEEKYYTEELRKYVGCMEQIKLRISSVTFILTNQRSTGYKYTDTEFICLQFRKILELIALANLVSNREEYAKKHLNFANHYHAKHILRDIERINPNFYPQPSRQVINEEKASEAVKIEEGYLTKEEFIQVYDECSELMHAENPFSMAKDMGLIYSKFQGWLNKIITLLNHHQVQLIDTNYQIWVLMENSNDGKVHAYLFELVGSVVEFDEKTKSNLLNYNSESELCPVHKMSGTFVPPSEIINKEKKLIVNFLCPEGHNFVREFKLR